MALLPIFCVARSSRTDLSMLVARALKIGKIADGGMPPTYETMHQVLKSNQLRPRLAVGRCITHAFDDQGYEI
jgi:hypothetical protein